MPVQARVEQLNALSDGRLEAQFSVLVDGKRVAVDTLVITHPQELTLEQIKDRIRDRVQGFKERYKKKAQAEVIVGQLIDVEL